MDILLVGAGGREHAIAWKMMQSPMAGKLYWAPGNPGVPTAIPVVAKTPEELADFAESHQIGLTMVGPEALLCEGIVDVFRARGLRIVGPDKEAAQLEGSKSYAKDFMARHGLPTAKAAVFTEAAPALEYLKKHGAPIVVKADGLAAGKGVVVAMELETAEAAVKSCFEGAFGAAGSRVLLEDCLVGEEASILALCDGKSIIPLASSQDHKRAYDGDNGPNTGGMGAYSPAPVATDELMKRIDAEVLQPFLKGVQADGLYFRGVIYAGIMVTAEGPKLLEFNVRFGDPETQAVLARLDSDLVEALVATADARLSEVTLKWSDDPAVCVVMASQGYPGSYPKGLPISGLDEAAKTGCVVFHAGTKAGENGAILTNGGRVLGVTARGTTLREAVDKAYAGVAKISWTGVEYRKDIAHKAFAHLAK
ncbi:MAG: phosphoribosylamine--glycine ligase [Lentisphaeria bacterium]|nr:phosphoribosylamine--glycine ligase [Lentisphaeria bacterium]